MRFARLLKYCIGLGIFVSCVLTFAAHKRHGIDRAGFDLMPGSNEPLMAVRIQEIRTRLTSTVTQPSASRGMQASTSTLPPVASTAHATSLARVPVTVSSPSEQQQQQQQQKQQQQQQQQSDSAGGRRFNQEPSPLAGLFDYVSPKDKLMGRAYWMGEGKIIAVLLRARSFQRPNTCTYNGAVTHEVSLLSGLGEMHSATVSPHMVVCTFEGVTVAPPTVDGAVVSVDADNMPLYNYKLRVQQKPLRWTMCMPCLHLRPRYVWIDQWMKYYSHRHGTDYFFVYSAIEGQDRAALAKIGVELAPTHSSVLNIAAQNEYKPYYFGQTYAMHDCLIMNRHLGTKWTVFQDFDEVLRIPAEFPTPFEYFESHKDATALTFGTWPVDVMKCRPESVVPAKDKEWPLMARMFQHHEQPYCGESCPNWQGRRKYVLQPDRHDRLFIHNPTGGKVSHLPVRTGSAFLLNYWSVQDTGMHYCEQTQDGAAVPVP